MYKEKWREFQITVVFKTLWDQSHMISATEGGGPPPPLWVGGSQPILDFFWQGGEGRLDIFWPFWLSLNRQAELGNCLLFFSKYDTFWPKYLSQLSFFFLFHTLRMPKCFPKSQFLPERCVLFNKLDEEGPVDNRPSTD